MEIPNNNVTALGESGQAAKVAAPKVQKEANSASRIETKGAPSLPKYEPKDLAGAIESLQAYVQSLGRDLSFTRDETIDQSIITVRDANTNQLVRQIPAEEVVEIARQIEESIQELRAGLLIRREI